MSTVAKLFTAIMNNRLSTYMERNGYLSDEQNGFRKMRACIDHLYVLSTIIKRRQHQKLSSYACFVDFAKAFDSVNHPLLWHKLLKLGIHGTFYRMCKAMYSGIQSCVRVGNYGYTNWFPIEAGVRQGDNMSPILFALYIEDLIRDIKSLRCGVQVGEDNIGILLYADDILLLSDSEHGLQTMLNTLAEWCSCWKLNINMDKTRIVHFRRSTVPISDYHFTIAEETVEYADGYRYLGLDLTATLDYTHSVNTLANASGRALGALVAKHYNQGGLHYEIYKKLYDATTVPIMDYGSGLWGAKVYDRCKTVQNRAQRTFLGVGKYTPVPAISGDMGWSPPHVRRQLNMIRLFARLIRMPPSRLTRRIFDWEYDLAMHGHTTWCKDAKLLLVGCGLQSVWDSRSLGGQSLRAVLLQAETSLMADVQTRWLSDIDAMPKLRTYKLVKTDYGCEDYLHVNLGIRQRSAIAKMRAGVFPIRVETGRYRRLPVEQRLCQVCHMAEVEHEEHFIVRCPLYADLRRELYHEIKERTTSDMDSLTDSEKLCLILSAGSVSFESTHFILNCERKRGKTLRELLHNRT